MSIYNENVNQIQEYIENIERALKAKGLFNVSVTCTLSAFSKGFIILYYNATNTSYANSNHKIFYFSDHVNLIEDCYEFISNLPSLEDMKRDTFIKALSNALELGRDAGIDTKVLNPLELTIKKLPNNILTHKK